MDEQGLQSIRVEYENMPLEREDLADDPLAQFSAWLEEAITASVPEPNAFVLSTADGTGRPSSRTLLLKGLDSTGLTFYTNYGSRKAEDIEVNPRGAALFLWLPQHRQVRIEGVVSLVSAPVSDEYFASRPFESQLASAVSPQSKVVQSRAELESLMGDLRARYPDGNVPRPSHWGGYRLEPDYYEFWQGQKARFHDRFRYRQESGSWVVERLAP